MRKLILFTLALVLFALPVQAGTYVQSKGATASSSTTVVATFDSTTATGNLIIVSCLGYGANGNFSAADGGPNTFTQILQTKWNNAFGNSVLWTGYVENATGKASHAITCTTTISEFRIVIWITEVSGILTSAALDKNAGATGSSTAPNSGNTATTAQANEFLYSAVGVVDSAAAVAQTAGASYTKRGVIDSANNYLHLAGEDRNVTSTGTYPGDWTLDSSQVWAAHIVTFKDAAAASTAPRKAVSY